MTNSAPQSYFHSLVDQFCWMAVEFKKRLDGMMGFVTFLVRIFYNAVDSN